MTNKRILFCRSNPIAPDPRVEKEARSLANAGYQVRILGWDRTGRLPHKEEVEGFTIQRLSIKASFGKGMMNLPQLLRWQFGLGMWLVRHHKEFDVIHACDFDTLIPASICKILWGKKVVYDIFDFYADHLRSTPNFIKSMIKSVDLKMIDQVDAVILADEVRQQQIAKTHPKKIVIIYNSPLDVLPSLNALQTTRRHHDLEIAYIGLLQVERGLLELLEVLKNHPEWTLLLAGFGGDEKRILEAAESLSNVFWFGRVSYERALQLSYDADVLIATYDPAIPNHRFSSPNKLFEAMMLGKPIIVAQGTNMDSIVEQLDCGVVVEYGDVRALEETLERMQFNPQFSKQLGLNARHAYEQIFNWTRMEERLIKLYQNISPIVND